MVEPLRILHIVVVLDRGGIETMLMNLYRAMDHEKIQFDFMVHGDKVGAYEEEIKSLGGRIIRVRAVKTPLDLIHWQKEIYQIFKDYKVVHSHLEQESRLILKQAKRAGCYLRIAHTHSTSSSRPLHKKIACKLFEWFVPWKATHFFACSTEAGLWLFGSKIVKQTNFILFKNAVNTSRFKYSELIRLKKRQELQIQDDCIVIGHVGNFSLAKNHMFMLDMFAELLRNAVHQKYCLVLVGNGALRTEIELKIDTLNVRDNVILLGSRSDVNELMQAMDIFVLPSVYEGLPVVTIEAQCAGLPCFISRNVSKECAVAKDAQFLPLSVNAWIDAIKDFTPQNNRADAFLFIQSAGWDIQDSVRFLTRFYQDIF